MTAPEILTSHLGGGLLMGLIYVIWLLRNLSRRMGEVTRMRPYYRGFDVGNLLLSIALLSYILRSSAALAQRPATVLSPTFTLLTFYTPLVLGLSLNVGLALVYWGWLFYQR